MSTGDAHQRLTGDGLDVYAADNLIAYLDEQRDAVGLLPDEKTIVVERFRDELGDWRLVLHSPYGAAVHAPWALVVAARMRERFGVDVQAMHADDGIVLRLPDVEYEGDAPEMLDAIALDPETLEAEVTVRNRGLGRLRVPLPRVRGPGAAVAAQADRQAPAAVAAASAGQSAAGGGRAVPDFPDRRRSSSGVPVRRLRRAGPGVA